MSTQDAAAVKDFMSSNMYCNVATVCEDGSPWNTPVFFGFDEDFSIYWRSSLHSQHSMNVRNASASFITMYDSRAKWGEGDGLFAQGTVEQLELETEVATGLKALDSRSPSTSKPEHYMNDNPRRVYKFTPSKLWHNVSSMKDGKFHDTREEFEVTT